VVNRTVTAGVLSVGRRTLASLAAMAAFLCAPPPLPAVTALPTATLAPAPTGAPATKSNAPATSPGMGAADHWAFFGQYCGKCHNAEDWAGGVAFDTMTPDDIPQNADTLEKAVRKLRGHLMPPAGKLQPDARTAREFVSWMETSLDHAASGRPEPGKVALHRLNRREYANAVRDLLALQVDPVALLPKDDSQHGFDNVADALQVSPSFLDQYLSAARTVAVQAVGNRSARPAGASYACLTKGLSPAEAVATEPAKDLNPQWGDPAPFVTMAFKSLWGHFAPDA
jgi:hypothetical protein